MLVLWGCLPFVLGVVVNVNALLSVFLDGARTSGLVTYALSMWLWEITVGITTPIETAAGMAFGWTKGILASGVGKIGGAVTAFLIGRFILFDYVHTKLQDNEM